MENTLFITSLGTLMIQDIEQPIRGLYAYHLHDWQISGPESATEETINKIYFTFED